MMMQNSKPTYVKIGAHQYAVEYDDLIYDRDEQQEYMGRVSYQELKLQVKTGRAPSQMAETFLHEVVHAIDGDRRLELTEHQVDQIAAGLLAVMIDNADVFGRHYFECFDMQAASQSVDDAQTVLVAAPNGHKVDA